VEEKIMTTYSDHPKGDAAANDRNWAMAAHILGFLTSIVGPLVIWLVKRRESRFVAFHALQALLFQAAIAILYYGVAENLILSTSFALLVQGLLVFLNFGVSAFAAYAGHEGKVWEIPVIGPFARRREGA
jgi:hypothetical protein